MNLKSTPKWLRLSVAALVCFTSTGLKAVAAGGITSSSELSNSKAYTITCKRGACTVSTNGTAFVSTKKSDGSVTNGNADQSAAAQQFAIYKVGDYWYIYNLKVGKFANFTKNATGDMALMGTVGTVPYTFKSTGDDTYPLTITTFDGTFFVNNDNGGDLRINTWKTIDDGNKYTIAEARDLTSDEIAAIEANLPLLPAKAFTVTSPRGTWCASADGTSLATTSINTSPATGYDQFALTLFEGSYYLYNVGTKKYIKKDGSLAAGFGDAVYFSASGDDAYPVMFYFLGGNIFFNMQKGGSSIVYNTYDTPDDGNKQALTVVDVDVEEPESPTIVDGDTTIVTTAGMLQSQLTTIYTKLTVKGVINGTDIKYLRELVMAGMVKKLDLSEVSIVAGGEPYYENYTTENDMIGEKMFYQCSYLQQMILPATVTVIKANAFAKTALTSIDIPDDVRTIGDDAFAYCNSLATVVIGKKVNKLSKGSFYSSPVTKAYVKPTTPPSPPSYLFSSSPAIYVYKEALADYKALGWNSYGALYGTLANYYPKEPEEEDLLNEACARFFEDAACTQLKAEYQAKSDEELTEAMTEAGLPETIVNIAKKVKNNTWADYEQEFRIHSYKAYSDANYWNEKLWVRCASYMGNPTGIYVQSYTDQLYVFVDQDVPEDASLYIAGAGVDQMFTSGKTGQKLKKGLNIVDGDADKLYYILYTADTKAMTKRLEEWPEIKIHIEGGKVDGYFDASRHTNADYKKLLNAAANSTFVCKGMHSIMNIRTSVLKETYPSRITKAVACLDSLSVWEKELSGMTEAVANGEKAGAPYYLSGGDAFYPGYFNNPTYVDNNSPGSVAHATEYGIHISLDASKTFLNPYVSNYDENGTAHEFGHQLQFPILLCGFTEGTNDLFSNYCRFHIGHRITSGNPLSTTVQEFVKHVPFNIRNVNNSCLRLFISLYLYYHQTQKNTSFYPELFKALRADRMQSQGSPIDNNNSNLKFVRKVCEIAQEDLTDFFTVYGFFEPTNNLYVEDYGDHYVTTKQADIRKTKATIAKYPVKNREILFIEDRVEPLLTTSLVTTAGQKRQGQDDQDYGDLGQFTNYLPGACEPANYEYYKADSIYAVTGSGGVGFLMLDADNNVKFASNSKTFCIPQSVGRDFTIYSVDADGTLREVPRGTGNAEESVQLNNGGQLQNALTSEDVIKLHVSGKINGKDIKYMRQLIDEGHLKVLDLSQAQVVANSNYPYTTVNGTEYYTTSNVMGDYCFFGFKKLHAIQMPSSITRIGSNAFAKSGIQMIAIPDKVTTTGGDAFAYCDNLEKVIIGSGVKTLEKGTFYKCDALKNVYVKALTPPSIGSYFLSSNPTIHVYASALSKYQASEWANYGTIVGDLTDDMIDGIIEMKNEKLKMQNDAAIYDLSGRKVRKSSIQKGIYIQNGKKILK